MNSLNIEYCAKCGRCNEVCPSYKVFLNESYSPRGRVRLISALKNKELSETDLLRRRLLSCLLCGSCLLCPVGISIPQYIYETRANMSKALNLYPFKFFSLHPDLFFSVLKTISPLLKFFKRYQIRKLSYFRIEKEKNSLKIYSKPLAKGRFAIFFGCSTNYMLPSLKQSLISLLNKFGYEVLIPKQHCCGAPLFSAGFKKEAVALSEKNLKIYNSFSIDGVLTPCPTCAHTIGELYKNYVGENIKVMNLSKVLEDSFELKSSQEAIFHISCHMKNYVKDDLNLSKLLKNSGFLIKSEDGCCGFAGLFSFLFERDSIDILNKKVLKYKNVDMLITSCPNCLLQFKFVLRKNVLHYVEIFNENLRKE
ncbi:MAG: (Fe-S)-binding protein [Thermodesulfovibrionaceae bacterium]